MECRLRLARRPLPPATIALVVLAAMTPAPACSDGANGGARKEAAAPAPDQAPPDAAAIRATALRSARVWRAPDVPISNADLKVNPPAADGFAAASEVQCRLVLEPVGGTTPKFNCELPGKDVVKVKYGTRNPELRAEVAATRLLRALGFGADRMYLVKSVRCAGCPPFPFEALKCLAETSLRKPCFSGGLDYSRHLDLQPAVIERRFSGDRIEATTDQGWAWYELDQIDAARGGSPIADVDAFRLMAVLLAHWDNKSENQRLVCLPGGWRADGSCSTPFALIQDAGGTFGPDKIDLRNWRGMPIWADQRTCQVSMKRLPFGGATFPDQRITEAGRRKLLGLLEQLSERQVIDLFSGSGVTAYDHLDASARDAHAWAAAFLDKVRQIREAGPCG